MRALLVALSVLLLAGTASAQAVPSFDMTRLYPTEAEFNRAIAPFQQAIQANARNARAQYWLGFAYVYAYRQWMVGAAPYAADYLGRAIPPLEEAVKLEPARPEAYMILHDVYHLMGDTARADEVMALMLRGTRPGWLPAVPAP
jgi:tetratricopeptide (TPR) repeat protein